MWLWLAGYFVVAMISFGVAIYTPKMFLRLVLWAIEGIVIGALLPITIHWFLLMLLWIGGAAVLIILLTAYISWAERQDERIQY